MQGHTWIKPACWGAVGGAVVVLIGGFWGMGWTTAGTADRMAKDRAEAAVVTALVPFCVAKAEHDPDGAKLAKVRTETSYYTRAQLVGEAGWATLPGMTTSDRDLATACSDKLQGPKT